MAMFGQFNINNQAPRQLNNRPRRFRCELDQILKWNTFNPEYYKGLSDAAQSRARSVEKESSQAPPMRRWGAALHELPHFSSVDVFAAAAAVPIADYRHWNRKVLDGSRRKDITSAPESHRKASFSKERRQSSSLSGQNRCGRLNAAGSRLTEKKLPQVEGKVGRDLRMSGGKTTGTSGGGDDVDARQERRDGGSSESAAEWSRTVRKAKGPVRGNSGGSMTTVQAAFAKWTVTELGHLGRYRRYLMVEAAGAIGSPLNSIRPLHFGPEVKKKNRNTEAVKADAFREIFGNLGPKPRSRTDKNGVLRPEAQVLWRTKLLIKIGLQLGASEQGPYCPQNFPIIPQKSHQETLAAEEQLTRALARVGLAVGRDELGALVTITQDQSDSRNRFWLFLEEELDSVDSGFDSRFSAKIGPRIDIRIGLSDRFDFPYCSGRTKIRAIGAKRRRTQTGQSAEFGNGRRVKTWQRVMMSYRNRECLDGAKFVRHFIAAVLFGSDPQRLDLLSEIARIPPRCVP
ncbi:hypothetical protein C8J57DRAFT_1224817 [Mycena rebaudengoi]|nr:hypothetical protein C8J57DRAFT_1224817 [Mycena rebaudengoi]